MLSIGVIFVKRQHNQPESVYDTINPIMHFISALCLLKL